MTWDQAFDSELSSTNAATLVGRSLKLGRQQLTESITLGTSKLDSEFTWRLAFTHLDTLTDEETRSEFDDLVEMLLRSQSSALTRCMLIMKSIPEPVVPTVMDQFQEIAEYETRLWRFKMERGDKPSIGRDIRVLPVGSE